MRDPKRWTTLAVTGAAALAIILVTRWRWVGVLGSESSAVLPSGELGHSTPDKSGSAPTQLEIPVAPRIPQLNEPAGEPASETRLVEATVTAPKWIQEIILSIFME